MSYIRHYYIKTDDYHRCYVLPYVLCITTGAITDGYVFLHKIKCIV